jgi:hypothetical protein
MPKSAYFKGHGTEVARKMRQTYGPEKAKRVFYATAKAQGQEPANDAAAFDAYDEMHSVFDDILKSGMKTVDKVMDAALTHLSQGGAMNQRMRPDDLHHKVRTQHRDDRLNAEKGGAATPTSPQHFMGIAKRQQRQPLRQQGAGSASPMVPKVAEDGGDRAARLHAALDRVLDGMC